MTKAAGLKYWFGPPRITGPVNAGFHDGRTGLRVSPLLEGLKPSWGVNGNPDWAVTMPLSDQPPSRRPCPHGTSQMAFTTPRFRTSNGERPQSSFGFSGNMAKAGVFTPRLVFRVDPSSRLFEYV